ncbi:MAG: 3-isopropylmalate dehydrogenase [Oscillospiraceae bacterium]|jgi:3-isopropylmalate dehydrogenase|nr:3-isopropylmalate dehydrogenase [Oscillospiraceae bacterium]
MAYKIAVLKGDGIGPEVVDEALKAFDALGRKKNIKFEYNYALIGGRAIDETGVPLPAETVEACKNSDSVLLGAVGGPKWDTLPGDKRPEKGLLEIRKNLGLYANLRPAKLYGPLAGACPIREEFRRGGVDIMLVRELTGGIYFGERGRVSGANGEEAFDVERYSAMEIERIARTAFEVARKRSRKVTSVDKANVLESSRLWRSVVNKIAEGYPDVALEHMFVDNAAMQLVRNPSGFDVILTSNIFGDILSDEASMVAGSIGILPSASLSEGKLGMYEPIHGSAPDIAGKNIANPLAAILSAAMLLRYSLGLEEEAEIIENAVLRALEEGWRTADIGTGADRGKILSCTGMGDKIASLL